MSLRVDKVQLDIIINNDQARKTMRALSDEFFSARKELKGMTEGTAEWIAKSERIKTLQTQMDNVKREIGITGMTIRELTSHQKELNMVLMQLRPNSPEFHKLNGELEETKARIKELKNVSAGLGSHFKEIFAGFTAGALAEHAIMGLVHGVKNFAEESIKKSLEYKDAEKLLLFALEGNVSKQKELIALSKERSDNTKYTRLEILEAEKFLAIQGRSQEQIKKTIQAGTELAAVTGVDLNTAVKDLDGSMELRLGKSLTKLSSEYRNLTQEQLKNGALIDLVAEKYKNVAEDEMATHEGKLVLLQKAWVKLKVAIGDSFTGGGYFDGGVTGLKSILDAVRENLGVFVALGKAVGVLAVGFIGYKSAMLTVQAGEFIATNTRILYTGATGLLAGAKAKLTGATIANTIATQAEVVVTEEATVATEALNVATKATPWGFLIGVIAAAGAALWAFTGNAKDANEVMEDVSVTALKNVVEEKLKIEELVSTAKNEALSKETRIKAIKELNEISPKYLGNLSLETINTENAKKAIDAYIVSLENEARVKAAKDKMVEIQKKIIDIEAKGPDVSLWKQVKEEVSGMFGGSYDADSAANKEQADQIAELTNQFKMLTRYVNEEKDATNGSAKAKVNAIKTVMEMTAGEIDQQKKLISDQDLLNEKIRLESLSGELTKDLKEKLTLIGKIIDARTKDAEHQAKANKKTLDDYAELQKEIRAISQMNLSEKLSETQREIQDAERKYEILLDKARKFLRDNENLSPEKKKQVQDEVGELEVQKDETLKAILTRHEEEFVKSIRELHEKMRVAKLSIVDKEIDAINKKYDVAIEEQTTAVNSAFVKMNTDLKNNLADGLISQEQFEQKSIALERDKNEMLDNLAQQTTFLNMQRRKEKNLTIWQEEKKLQEDLKKIHNKDDIKYILDPDAKAEAEIRQKYAKLIADTNALFKYNKVKGMKDLAAIEKAITDEVEDYKAKKAAETRRKIAKATLDAAQRLSDTLFSAEAQSRQDALNATIANLEKSKETELANQSLTDAQRNEIEEKYKKKEAEEKTKAWKNEQTAAIEQAAINGALAITNIWATTPKADYGVMTFVLTGLALAATIEQIAVIKNRKPPQFFYGGYTGDGPADQPAGTVHKREYVTPAWLMEDPIVKQAINYIEAKRVGRWNSTSSLRMPTFNSSPGMNMQAILESISFRNATINAGGSPQGNDKLHIEMKAIRSHLEEYTKTISRLNAHLDKGITTEFYIHDYEKRTSEIAKIRDEASYTSK